MPSDEEFDLGDWEKLETIKTFDVSDGSISTKLLDTTKSSKDGLKSISSKATAPVSLLVESLVQQLCSMLDPDPMRSDQLYRTICAQLHHMNLIDETYMMGEFDVMRSQYQRALYQLATVARGQQDLPLALQSVWPLPETVGMSWSRYHREFDEINFIAGGGFGRVYRARHKLDGIEYAVKKITIKYTTINRVLSHLAEVKTFASLNHTSIVPYKAAWLEPLFNNGLNNEIEGNRRKKKDIKSSIVPVRSGDNSKLLDNAIALFGTETDDDEDDEYDDDGEDEHDNDVDEENSEKTEDFENFDFNMQNKRFMSKKKSMKIFERITTNNDESSDFVQFCCQESKVSIEDVNSGENAVNHRQKEDDDKALCKQSQHCNNNYISNVKSDLSIDESQPHLKLKWATLYIQMAFRPLTLRSWLDDRNKYSDFNEFYKSFLKKSALDVQSSSDKNDGDGNRTADESNPTNQQQSQETNRRQSNGNSALDECLAKQYNSVDVAIDIFTQVLNGLNYIHLQNIVHHDIKPSNIFIGCEKNGKLYVQLGDFGLACPLQAKHTPEGMIGTLTYAAPEQLDGHCNPKSDLFSLGIILLELLVPFTTDMERMKTIEQARKGVLPQELSQKYITLLKKLLQHHKRRPDTFQISEILSSLRITDDSNILQSPAHNEPQQTELQKQLNVLMSELSTLKLQLSSNASSTESDLPEVPQPTASTSQPDATPQQALNSSYVSKTKIVNENSNKSVSIQRTHKHYKKELRKKKMELQSNISESSDKDKQIAVLQNKLSEMSRKECELSQEVQRLREMLNERLDGVVPPVPN